MRGRHLWRLGVGNNTFRMISAVPVVSPNDQGTDTIAARADGELAVRVIGERRILVLHHADDYQRSEVVDPDAEGVSMAEPEVLRAPRRGNLAEHDQRPGGAAGSTSPGSNATGRTSCGSSAPSTTCCPVTGVPPRSATRSPTTGGSPRRCTSCASPTSPATKSQANLQEGRHSLARKIFHRRHGQLYQRYQDGMEDQTGALGLVLNALVLFNTRYMDAAVNQLRADGFYVRDEEVGRLSRPARRAASAARP